MSAVLMTSRLGPSGTIVFQSAGSGLLRSMATSRKRVAPLSVST
jgi:hypothetical protein